MANIGLTKQPFYDIVEQAVALVRFDRYRITAGLRAK
jgi:hypothetical protein